MRLLFVAMRHHTLDGTPVGTAAPVEGLVGESKCRAIIWPDPESRPSRRWFLELKARGLLPFRRIGRRIFFDPGEVRAALDHQFKIQPRRSR